MAKGRKFKSKIIPSLFFSCSFSKSVADLNLQAANLAIAKTDLEQETQKRTDLEKDLASTRDQLDELRTTSASERKKSQQQIEALKVEMEATEKVHRLFFFFFFNPEDEKQQHRPNISPKNRKQRTQPAPRRE